MNGNAAVPSSSAPVYEPLTTIVLAPALRAVPVAAASATSNTIAAFSVDGAAGKLTYLSSTPTEKQPRGFQVDPKGRYLVATGEKSDTISVYAIDAANGSLKLLNRYATGKGSNWVEIVTFD